MISMTGFGEGRAADDSGGVTVQITAVNNRSWSLHLRSDLHDLAVEDAVRQELRGRLVRGSVTVQLSWRPAHATGLDLVRLEQAWRELASCAQRIGAPPPDLATAVHLLPAARGATEPTSQALVRRALSAAIAQLQGMRAAEGAALEKDILLHLQALRGLLSTLTQQAAARPAAYRDLLLARLQDVLAGQAMVTPEHLVRELALHAERIDVSEELVRLAAHLEALQTLLGGGEDAVGRKLEFLLQECAREVNTTGAKANDASLAALALEAKYIIEQMKEQAANIA